jgi:aminobenzoyl-glutamate utilization protein B
MKKNLVFLSLVLCLTTSYGQKKLSPTKQAVINSVNSHEGDLIKLSDQIWAFAELAMDETQSANALADYAESQGFKVDRGVADMPTAFIATYGNGSPIIGIMGEFDALPGLSQKAQPTKEALSVGAPGHGCGHNMFGPGSLGAAIAIKELIAQGKLKGTIRFYGTPAEEDKSGKTYMARAGLFDDLDVCLDWHPWNSIQASTQSSQAVNDYYIEFFGKAAHAAADPWNGRSATDGADLFIAGINAMREHIKPSVRIHHVTLKAGDVPNVIPEYAKVWLWVRDSKRTGVQEVSERMENIAKGAALMAGVDYKITLNSGIYEILVNRTGASVLQRNLEILGPITYSSDENNFAKSLQKSTNSPEKGLDGTITPLLPTDPNPTGGSTDVGDVSWIVPEISLYTTTAPIDTPWHSWAVVACGGMSIGHKGMIFSSKALAMTMVDLFENPQLRADIRKEFLERKGTEVYKAMVPEGPPPGPGH